MNEKTKIHTVYKLKDGTRVPSVTTILHDMRIPGLEKWAWECGVAGLKYEEVRDQAADIGRLAHYLIMCHLREETPDTASYSPDNLKQAESCLLQYLEWEKSHDVKPILIEQPLVSERYRYGGTIDLLAEVDGELVLIDYKTGKAIYDNYFYQVAAYQRLLNEAGYKPSGLKILRMNREFNDFEERTRRSLVLEFDIFKNYIDIYQKKAMIRKGEK